MSRSSVATGLGTTFDFADESASEPYVDHPAVTADEGTIVRYTDDAGVDKVAFAKVEPTLGITSIIEQDYAEAYAPLLSARRNAYVLLPLTLLVIMLAAYLLARWLARPIQNLTDVAEAISMGKLGVSIEGTKRGDELGSLARAIERLRVSVQVMFTELSSQQR